MGKVLNFLTNNKMIGMATGIMLFIAGALSRLQFIDSNIAIGFIIPLLFISLSFGIIFSSVFKRDNENVNGLFVKSVLAPWAIVISIIALDKFGIGSPLFKAGALFLVNIAFFGKEINKAFN